VTEITAPVLSPDEKTKENVTHEVDLVMEKLSNK
jgi:hypothetical protein